MPNGSDFDWSAVGEDLEQCHAIGRQQLKTIGEGLATLSVL